MPPLTPLKLTGPVPAPNAPEIVPFTVFNTTVSGDGTWAVTIPLIYGCTPSTVVLIRIDVIGDDPTKPAKASPGLFRVGTVNTRPAPPCDSEIWRVMSCPCPGGADGLAE
jgi:hypothetical protein